jgi:superfamily II DNA helicase RecQ
MRQVRTELAQEDGVPLYRVMTNDQMAQMVENRVRTEADMKRIPGLGEARLERYGARVLDFLNQVWGKADEKGGKAAGSGR